MPLDANFLGRAPPVNAGPVANCGGTHCNVGYVGAYDEGACDCGCGYVGPCDDAYGKGYWFPNWAGVDCVGRGWPKDGPYDDGYIGARALGGVKGNVAMEKQSAHRSCNRPVIFSMIVVCGGGHRRGANRQEGALRVRRPRAATCTVAVCVHVWVDVNLSVGACVYKFVQLDVCV